MNKLKLVAALIFLAFVGHYIYVQYSNANPFEGVDWIEDSPGATERYVTFTPVSKASRKPIGPTVGADYAVLRFKDLDGDGAKEAIIETEKSTHLEYYQPQRHVLKFKTDQASGPKFEYIEGPELNR